MNTHESATPISKLLQAAADVIPEGTKVAVAGDLSSAEPMPWDLIPFGAEAPEGVGDEGRPHDSAEAIVALEHDRASGVGVLALPAPTNEWLEQLLLFGDHCRQRYPVLLESELGAVFDLRPTGGEASVSGTSGQTKVSRARQQEDDFAVTNGPGLDPERRLESSRNVFADAFGQQSPEEWVDTLVASLTCTSIAGVDFPTFPPPEFQTALHGHSGEHSLREALTFYNFVVRHSLAGPKSPAFGQGYMLDFGAGWGRITRLFMRDFPLKHIIGFEPHGTFCTIARANNPFVSFVSGDALPPTMLAQGRFDLAVGWSVMSHLSEHSGTAWLREFGRILATGGSVVLTTWGLRFLEHLKREEQMAAEGQDIHWYSRICIDHAGNLDDRIAEYNDGRFVWFDSGMGALYGEACLSERALRTMLADNDIPLSLEVFDTSSLAQDAFILKRV